MSPSSILQVHQVSHNFHRLANLYPRHKLNLEKLLTRDENIKAFKKSSRIYEKIKLHRYRFQGLTEAKFNQIIDLLNPTSVYVKELVLVSLNVKKSWIVRILKQLSNLENLHLALLFTDNVSSQEVLESDLDGKISLPKLKKIVIFNCEDAFFSLLMDLNDCEVTDFISRSVARFQSRSVESFVASFIKLHGKSLKKLDVWNSFDSQKDSTLIGDLKDLSLEILSLTQYVNEGNLLQNFFCQLATTLKSLSLGYCGLTDQLLEAICDTLTNLETFRLDDRLENIDSGFQALQKLTKLKSFSVHKHLVLKKNVLEGFGFVVNENLVEIEAPIDGATPEFIEKFAACVPNLKRFNMGIDTTVIIKHVLQQCKNLNELTINHRRLNNFERKDIKETAEITGEILEYIRDYGGNLKKKWLVYC